MDCVGVGCCSLRNKVAVRAKFMDLSERNFMDLQNTYFDRNQESCFQNDFGGTDICLPSLDELAADHPKIRWTLNQARNRFPHSRHALCRGSPVGPVGEVESSSLACIRNSLAPEGPAMARSTISSSSDVGNQSPHNALSPHISFSSDMSWPEDLDEPLFASTARGEKSPLEDLLQLPDLENLCEGRICLGGKDSAPWQSHSLCTAAPVSHDPVPKKGWAGQDGSGWHSALRIGVETLAAVLIVDRGQLRGDDL